MRNNIGIIIPTRNVSGMVLEILMGISDYHFKHLGSILIVDNGSTDGTIIEIQNFIARSKYKNKFYFHLNNQDLGYGYSINFGLNHFYSQKDIKLIGLLHSDNQFSSKQLLDLYISHKQLGSREMLSVARQRNVSSKTVFRQMVRNFGNEAISILGKISTGNKTLQDFNTPFFFAQKSLLFEISSQYNLGNDLLFHPRLNLIFATSSKVKSLTCDWKRASRTSVSPIAKLGIQIVSIFIKFAWYLRLRNFTPMLSYELATKLKRI
jgi:glycosyltransferase involved in cell wall biosynthesis